MLPARISTKKSVGTDSSASITKSIHECLNDHENVFRGARKYPVQITQPYCHHTHALRQEYTSTSRGTLFPGVTETFCWGTNADETPPSYVGSDDGTSFCQVLIRQLSCSCALWAAKLSRRYSLYPVSHMLSTFRMSPLYPHYKLVQDALSTKFNKRR
ncbi:hypothetical protein PISMIDRAFT_682726 [Pisolithus microcarpus 441]|uniref:Uncharacterized protein n=1 Tax=Pisolithus microcarpus 441 TaxID=765257 RepID=A0A0C9ZJ49_9AGAM|nr:hypothetical protein PISMIDRAFT_682726 [Pisolithus microcarpus 441]